MAIVDNFEELQNFLAKGLSSFRVTKKSHETEIQSRRLKWFNLFMMYFARRYCSDRYPIKKSHLQILRNGDTWV